MSCPITLNHGVIGNGRILALISPSTHIDWLCMPRFDSASVFARILDVHKGGTFAFLPDCADASTEMHYVLNTNVLRTQVSCSEGRFDVYDYAPRIPLGLDVDAPIEIQRLIVPREGTVRVRVVFDPRPEYAAVQQPKIVSISGGLQIGDGASALYLRTNAPLPYLESGQPLRIDEPFYFAVSYGKASDTDSVASAQRVRDLTIAGWRAWAKSCALPSFASLPVLRSALVPQAARLHRHRRDHRRRDDEHSGGGRLRTDVGLPLLLAARRGVRCRGTEARRPSGRRRGVRVIPPRRRGGRPAAAAVRDRRRTAARGISPGPPRGILRQPSRAGRQRRVLSAAARSDGRDDPLSGYHHLGPAGCHRRHGAAPQDGRTIRQRCDDRG